MKINDFSCIVDKTIQTNTYKEYNVDINDGAIIFDEELEINSKEIDMYNVYKNNRIRIVIQQNKNNDICVHGYYCLNNQADSTCAFEFLSNTKEIDSLGGIEEFVYEATVGKKGLFSDRGSSVC